MERRLSPFHTETDGTLAIQTFALNARAGGACGSIPCSGNGTCHNYGCGYCEATKCVAEEEEAETASSSAAAMPAATSTMPNVGGNVRAAGAAVALAGLGAAAALL